MAPIQLDHDIMDASSCAQQSQINEKLDKYYTHSYPFECHKNRAVEIIKI